MLNPVNNESLFYYRRLGIDPQRLHIQDKNFQYPIDLTDHISFIENIVQEFYSEVLYSYPKCDLIQYIRELSLERTNLLNLMDNNIEFTYLQYERNLIRSNNIFYNTSIKKYHIFDKHTNKWEIVSNSKLFRRFNQLDNKKLKEAMQITAHLISSEKQLPILNYQGII